MKGFADDKKDVTRKLDFVLGMGENIVRKRKKSGYNYFLLFPQCFQTALVFTCLPYKSFKNTVGKGEIACNEQFLTFCRQNLSF